MTDFTRPTLQQIIDRDVSDFDFELGSNNARLPNTPERAFVRAHAGVVHGLYGRLAHVARNAFVDTCEDERLIKMAAFFGIFQIPAERATGNIYFFGNEGVVVPKGTLVVRSDGVQYETTVEASIPVPPDPQWIAIPSRAVLAGAAGNDPGPNAYTLVNPISGIKHFAEPKTPYITGGVDAESTLSLRTRLKERLSTPPNSGGPGSYVAWAKLAPGVTRVWEYGLEPKPGHVTVLFMRDGDLDPFPGPTAIDVVKAKILEYAPHDLAGLHVQAPIDLPLTLEIHISPDTAALRAASVTALQDRIAATATPPKTDGGVYYKSNLYEALGTVDGLDDYKIAVTPVDSDITVNKFELLTLLDPGAQITWI